MNTENNFNSIITVVVIGAVAIAGIMFGGKEIISNRTEIINKVIDKSIESSDFLSGLVHTTQEIFPQGIKCGTSEAECINNSGQWTYQINGTTGAFSGAITGATTLTITGETNVDSLIYGGDIATMTYSDYAITAAEVCNSSVIQWTGVTTTVYMPTAVAMIADCLPSTGDTKSFLFWSIATSTLEQTATLAATSTDLGEENILLEPEGSGVVIIEGGEFAKVIITNINGVTTTVEVDAKRAAD